MRCRWSNSPGSSQAQLPIESALGKEPGRIQIYARDGKSSNFDTFNSLVLKPRKASNT